MKFTSSTLFSAVMATISALLFTATGIEACEKPCQTGITHAFADRYAIEIKPIFADFAEVLDKTIFNKAKASPKIKQDVIATVDSTVKSLENSFAAALPNVVFKSIFLTAPVFKGSCQHPTLVTQPKVGVPWKRSDCRKQNYICGNPPAICHFLNPIVKPRNVKLINQALQTAAAHNGTFFNKLSDAVSQTAKNDGLTGKTLEKFVEAVDKNIDAALHNFVHTFAADFCTSKKCDKYDAVITKLLLSFP